MVAPGILVPLVEVRILIPQLNMGPWCKECITEYESVGQGLNPCGPTNMSSWESGLSTSLQNWLHWFESSTRLKVELS